MTSISYVPMRWWHIEAVLPLEAALFGTEQWSAPMFWSELAHPDSRSYEVALRGDELVGYAGLCIYAEGEPAWIQTVGVAPAAQRAGVGTTLLMHLIDGARKRNSPTLNLEVRVDNEPAQLLYAKHGFEAVTVRRGYYQPSNVDALMMTLDLRAQ